MPLHTSNANPSFLPDAVSQLVVQPAQRMSVAAAAVGGPPAIIRGAIEPSGVFRVPVITADPTAAWTAEGAAISQSSPVLDQEEAPYRKLAALTVVSNEMARDSDPAAQEFVGQGLARDIARKMDLAFFGTNTAAPTLQPQGLEDVTGVTEIAGGLTNLDAFIQGALNVAGLGDPSVRLSWVANPADALELATLKDEASSNRPLLAPSANDADGLPVYTIAGAPLYISPAVTAGTVWGVPSGRVLIAVRQDATLERSDAAYFGSDSVGLRCITRVAFAYPHAAAIQKVTVTP
ncbi:phage major capsid protein [Promicromonospora iranensis]|uniref:HK97 family phage major capsid protein n=1 Tax=Promicromonospora iranensis TaxID=1105144 RepID=A0ABU2CWF4_9MICO|nr:phage major capsid protein [Promicromonospora iranensis]MDR7385685.1 HK97 family phage major capsid protein [Promicromonospora iranensis]